MVADLRVLIVADDPLTRAGLAALLAGQAGCIIVGQTSASTDLERDLPGRPASHAIGDTLAAAIEAYRPDVLLWDLGWNPRDTIQRLAELTAGVPPVAALLPNDAHAAGTWVAGARGLLLRSVDGASLAAALVAVGYGLAVMDPSLIPVLALGRDRSQQGEWENGERSPFVEGLTPRELEVLHLIAEGLANKAIAGRLGISEHTVKFHVNAILGKLGVQSRTEAVVQATRLGLIFL
jgi:two-component system, NarL family, nitrate/nitrite response regulator NarL